MEDNIFIETIEVIDYPECHTTYTIEQIYQEFKERLIKELRVSTDELLNPAGIVDISDD